MIGIKEIKERGINTWNKLWNLNGQEEIETPINESIAFELKYKKILIGILVLENGIWTFEYSEEFKNQDILAPLTDFPQLEKIYKSNSLYPFFLIRIPSLKQPKVQQEIKEHDIDERNAVDLLKFFGHRTIANPFLLYYYYYLHSNLHQLHLWLE